MGSACVHRRFRHLHQVRLLRTTNQRRAMAAGARGGARCSAGLQAHHGCHPCARLACSGLLSQLHLQRSALHVGRKKRRRMPRQARGTGRSAVRVRARHLPMGSAKVHVLGASSPRQPRPGSCARNHSRRGRGNRRDRRRGPRSSRRTVQALDELGRHPAVHQDQFQAEHPGVLSVRLAGSSLGITLGELNILPDYLSHPADIDAAPASYMGPLIGAVRALNYRELQRLMGRTRLGCRGARSATRTDAYFLRSAREWRSTRSARSAPAPPGKATPRW